MLLLLWSLWWYNKAPSQRYVGKGVSVARHWLASSHSRSVVCLAAAIACFTYARGGEALQPESQPRLKVSVLAGEGVVHNLREPTPAEIVVEVRNEAGEPVAGAIVVFQLPSMGPSGLFPGETLFATVVSDSLGRAAVKGLRPNLPCLIRSFLPATIT